MKGHWETAAWGCGDHTSDAVVVHFGHNNVWDIRIAEDNQDKIGTFKEIFDKVKAIPQISQARLRIHGTPDTWK